MTKLAAKDSQSTSYARPDATSSRSILSALSNCSLHGTSVIQQESAIGSLDTCVDRSCTTPATTASDLNSEPSTEKILETVDPFPQFHVPQQPTASENHDKDLAEARAAAYQEELRQMENQVAATEALLEEAKLARDAAETKFYKQGIELGQIARELNCKLHRAVHEKDTAEARTAAYKETVVQMQHKLADTEARLAEVEISRDLAEAKIFALDEHLEQTAKSFETQLYRAALDKEAAEARNVAYLSELTHTQDQFANVIVSKALVQVERGRPTAETKQRACAGLGANSRPLRIQKDNDLRQNAASLPRGGTAKGAQRSLACDHDLGESSGRSVTCVDNVAHTDTALLARQGSSFQVAVMDSAPHQAQVTTPRAGQDDIAQNPTPLRTRSDQHAVGSVTAVLVRNDGRALSTSTSTPRCTSKSPPRLDPSMNPMLPSWVSSRRSLGGQVGSPQKSMHETTKSSLAHNGIMGDLSPWTPRGGNMSPMVRLPTHEHGSTRSPSRLDVRVDTMSQHAPPPRVRLPTREHGSARSPGRLDVRVETMPQHGSPKSLLGFRNFDTHDALSPRGQRFISPAAATVAGASGVSKCVSTQSTIPPGRPHLAHRVNSPRVHSHLVRGSSGLSKRAFN